MYRQIQKGLAVFALTAVMVLLWMPLCAKAAADPAFQETFSAFYENRANNGVYDIQVNNVQKGYILKWHITGKGKGYASFDTQKVIAQGKTAENTLTIDSKGEAAFAAGERIRITVNVYTAKWRLVNKITFAGKLQCKAKAIDMDTSGIKDLNMVTAGEAYELKAKMTPSNSTSKVYWAVKDSKGTDCSSQITQDGKWTPVEPGTYTISVTARNSEKGAALCTKEVQATVGSFLDSVKQTASDRLQVTFNASVSDQYKENDFVIKSGESTVLVKKIKYSEDGRTAELTTATNFADARNYTVSCAGYSKEFTSSVGKPVKLSITTTSAQAGKYTKIEYVLLDAKDIDVTNTVRDGIFYYTANATNGLLDKQTNQLFMTTVGSLANVTLEYTSADGTVRLKDMKTIVCVAQKTEEASETKFTLTKNMQVPTFKEADVRELAVGDTMYAHFIAYNEDDAVITYDKILFSSQDPDSLIISAEGKITPIKAGSVTVVVTAYQGSVPVTYTYSINIKEARCMASVQMKETALAMSNVSITGYQKVIPVTAKDQYGENLALTNETGVVTEAYGKALSARYDNQKNSVIISAAKASGGIYNCTLAMTVNGVTLNQNFTVIVSAPSGNQYTYQIEADSEMDLTIDETTSETDKLINVRVAEYRGGVFNNYMPILKATLRKGNATYGNDMTAVTGSALALDGGNVLTLTPMVIRSGTDGVDICEKAETGTYTITVEFNQRYYYGSTTNRGTLTANIVIKDEQSVPEYTIQKLTTDTVMQNALQVAVNCISIPDGGSILNCSAAGTNLKGAAIPVRSGEQIHITSISVRAVLKMSNNRNVYVTHEIPINRTFTNK